jgi:hypothetical protein
MLNSYRFSMIEVRQLSRRAWEVRRFEAARLCIPVLSVSWRMCLVVAKKEALRRDTARVKRESAALYRGAALVRVGVPMYAALPVSRRSLVSVVARAAVLVLSVLSI